MKHGRIFLSMLLPLCCLVFITGCTHEFSIRRQLHFREHLKRLNTALVLYAKAHNNQFPRMQTKQDIIVSLRPYHQARYPRIRIEDEFSEPGMTPQCAWNHALSERRIADYPHADKVVTFFGDQSYDDNHREVIFLDGHADQVESAEWTRIKPQ